MRRDLQAVIVEQVTRMRVLNLGELKNATLSACRVRGAKVPGHWELDRSINSALRSGQIKLDGEANFRAGD